MEDFRVICRTERVKQKACRTPQTARANPCLHTVAPQARRCVENLLTHGEFPVEYATTKIFLGQDSARIVAEQRSQAWIDRQLIKVHASLEAISTGLAEKPWCSGIHMTLADIAVGCALGYLAFRFPQIGWREEQPNLARLADKMNARQSFIDTAPA